MNPLRLNAGPLCLAGVLPLLLPAPTLAQAPNFNLLNMGVVRIQSHRSAPGPDDAEDETGTGLVISTAPDTIRILTAAHVVHGASTVTVRFFSDKVVAVPATVLPVSSDALDLAVLEVHADRGIRLPTGVPVLQWLPSGSLSPTMHIWTMNGDWEPAPNNIVRLDREGDVRKFEYTANSVGEGYSGGPVFDDLGRLVGIHLAQASRSDYKLSIAVKISSAIETLDVLGYSPGSFNAVMPAKMPDMASLPAAAKQAPATPLAIGARGTGPTQPSNADTRQRWRSLNNNQIYTFRLDGSHFYIMQSNGLVVADLAQSKNGKKFTGSSILSTCPGSGYMEIDSIAEDRVDGRLEQKPNVSNGVCGGLFGALRQTIAIAFIREP